MPKLDRNKKTLQSNFAHEYRCNNSFKNNILNLRNATIHPDSMGSISVMPDLFNIWKSICSIYHIDKEEEEKWKKKEERRKRKRR